MNFSSLIMGMVSGPPPTIARTPAGGFIVSTVDSFDSGPETAILDKNNAYPVERYATRAAALKGHKRWVAFAEKARTGTKITRLGYGDLMDDEPCKLASINRKSPRWKQLLKTCEASK